VSRNKEEADRRQAILDEDDSIKKLTLYYSHEKSGVTNSSGKLTLTGLKPMTAYTVYRVYGKKELEELIAGGVVDPKEILQL